MPAGISYRVGDHLSVVPRNDPALVDSVARRFGFLPADQIRLQVAEGRRAQLPVGDTVSVGRLLSEFVELQQVATRKQIQIMSEHTRCPVTKPKLLAYLGDDAAATERYRAEILTQAQIGVRPAGRASGLRIAVPRLSRNAVAAGAALLFDLVVALGRSLALQRHGRAWSKAPPVPGAASTRASARTTSPAAAPARPSTPRCARPRPGFRLPDDAGVPIIMIGPGTGLAPFRGFLQEREAPQGQGRQPRPGHAVLRLPPSRPGFSLCGRAEGIAAAADITELHTAFSRADGPKTYVQHLVAAQKDRVWSLIEQGAIIYVCGDGGKMEPDVKAALVAIYRERKGADAEAGLRWIDELGTSNRYVLDVWAGG